MGLEAALDYTVGPVHVQVVRAGGSYRYVAQEPPLPEEGSRVLLMMRDYFLRHPERDPLRPEDRWLAAEVLGVSGEYERYRLSIDYYLARDIRGYGKLDVLIRDPHVEEVGVNGPGPVRLVHREVPVGWIESNIRVRDRAEALSIALRLAQRGGETVSPAFPIREFRLPEGHRVTVALRGVARETVVTIRKFPEQPLGLGDLVGRRMLPPRLAALLELAVLARGMILIVGPQGTGKTTLMGALLERIPGSRRIVTVEEVPELRLRHPNWVALYPREPAVLDPGASRARVGFRRLLRAALRMRSDYVAVAEARGREVRYIFEAAALGSGSLATFHAGGLGELERRLRLLGVTEDLLDLIWIVAVTGAHPERGRRVVAAYSREEEGWRPIAAWDPGRDEWSTTGPPPRLASRIRAGLMIGEEELEELLEQNTRAIAAEGPLVLEGL